MPKNGRGGGGGFSNRGRGGGGGAGRGRGLGFVPFSGHGNTLGDTSGNVSESSPSARGGGGGGRPYRGRGRGGNLSAQGQNRVAFDYAGLSQGRANATAEQSAQQLDDDFVIEPHSRYKHKVAPHLENAQHSDTERKRAPPTQSSQIPAEAIAYASGSRDVNPKFRRGVTPTSFPEFHTSRGSSGYKQRPPEETEDARYLAGVPGLRRDQQRSSRFDSRTIPYANPLRKPVSFVKALHKPDADPLDEEQAQHKRVEEPAAQALEALQQQSHTFDPFGHSSKHAGLGFSNKTEEKSPNAAVPPPAEFVFDDAMDQDEVNALLAAFPGSKELDAGESMLDSRSAFDLMPMPSIITNKDAAPIHEQDDVVVTDVVYGEQDAAHPSDEVYIKQEVDPLPAHMTELREYVDSDSEEERQLDAILAQSRIDTAEAHQEDEEQGVESNEDVGFVIDLTGSAPTDDEPMPQQRNRVALGDVLPPSAVQPSPGMQQKTRAPKKPRKRIPREGDSDLEWGSDGLPGQRDDGENTDGEIVAAAAGISFSDAAPVPEPNHAQGWDVDELMLARAIRADRHEWDREMIPIDPPSSKSRKRGGERAKRSMPNKAAGLRKAAETSRARKEHEAAIVADYMENIMNQQDDEDDDEQVDEILGQDAAEGSAKPANRTVLDIMSQFLHGMDPQKGGKQLSFGDVQDEINIAETKEWMTESEDESGSDGPNEASIGRAEAARRQMSAIAARKQKAGQVDTLTPERFEHDDDDEDLVEQLRIILMGQSNSETDSGSPHPYSDDVASDADSDDSDDSVSIDDDIDEDESDEAPGSGSDNSDSDSDEDESDDEDDGMFQGKNTWADEDEAFIKALSAKMGPGKKSQKDVFKAISRGDFSEMVDDEMEIDSDDPAFGLGSVPTARNGKRKGRKWNQDDLWAEELQKQWDKDRASKAVKKQQRNMEKAAAALNPFPNTHGKMSKKAAKQMRRADKRDARAALKAHGNNALAAIQAAGGIDAVDQGLLAFGGRGTDLSSIGLDQRFAFNMDELDEQIRMFLVDRGKSTLTLQAMDKFARAEVHQLAAAYNLKSQSKGKGDNRFPTLIKTSRSGVNVNERKVRRILLSNSGARFGNDAGRSDFKNKNKRLGKGARRMVGQDGGGAPAPKNREGEMVGYGADKIGADNIGHRLLAAMGWSEGMGIGHSGGMANPVAATVKITKGGLGF